MLEGAVLGAIVPFSLRTLSEIPVINLLGTVVRMEEIRPRNVHQNSVSFRRERYIRIIENLNCRKRSFTRFIQ